MAEDEVDWFDQTGYQLRFGWGPNGLRRLAPVADVVVIIDVLSFSTSVDVALGRGAIVLPYRWHDGSEDAFAEEHGATVATKKATAGSWSLRPSSLVDLPAGTRLVLPSPNGSALAFAARDAGASAVMVGSLRNADAVAAAAAGYETISVIAAGERWKGTVGPLRPAIEDLFGAGAILDALVQQSDQSGANKSDGGRSVSPEARTAIAAFRDAAPELADRLRTCGSGRELIDKGFPTDVELAADLNVSGIAPTLDGAELVDRPAQ